MYIMNEAMRPSLPRAVRARVRSTAARAVPTMKVT